MHHNGPATAYMLGDLGAEVIKVEPPVTGDYQRGVQSTYDVLMTLPGGYNAAFETANRNKRSIVIDLNNSTGRSVLYRLVEKSDVFITNFTKRVIKKLEIDYDTLRKYNQSIIYASTTAYGGEGPMSDNRGYDPVAQALSGAMWSFGDRDSPEPSLAVGSIFDQIAATLLAYGILAALVHRERTGVGQAVESSLLAGGIHIQAQNLNTFLWRGRAMARFSRKRCRNPLTNYYKCADGKWILLSEPQSAKYWHSICVALGIERLENNPRYNTVEVRRQNHAEFISILDEVFSQRSRKEWLDIFGKYDFAYSPIYDYEEVASSPQTLMNEYIVDMEHPALGKLKTVGFPVRFSQTPAAIQCAAPEFGAHTETVLTEIGGYSWDDIALLREEGALG
jgi:crotonobetainyl-CoA:carnitine CoA-transferase CaiB-like acyl-CoA transferase